MQPNTDDEGVDTSTVPSIEAQEVAVPGSTDSAHQTAWVEGESGPGGQAAVRKVYEEGEARGPQFDD